MEIIFVFLQAVLADLTTLQVIPLIQLSLFSKWKHLVSSTEPRGPSAQGQAHPNVRRFASNYLDRKKLCVFCQPLGFNTAMNVMDTFDYLGKYLMHICFQ